MSEQSPPAPDTAAVPGAPVGPVRYDIVFDCRDRMIGTRLLDRLERVVDDAESVERGEEGPTWSVNATFRDAGSADVFFRSDAYRQFCIEARRACRSSVLVVPLGSVEDSAR